MEKSLNFIGKFLYEPCSNTVGSNVRSCIRTIVHYSFIPCVPLVGIVVVRHVVCLSIEIQGLPWYDCLECHLIYCWRKGTSLVLRSFAAHSSLSHWPIALQQLLHLSFCLRCDLLGGQRSYERYCGQWHGGLRNSVEGSAMRGQDVVLFRVSFKIVLKSCAYCSTLKVSCLKCDTA